MQIKKSLSAVIAVSMLASAAPVMAQKAQLNDLLPYQDTSLSFEERAADLVSRMTLEEKANQTGRNAPAIPRLGVSKYNYWSEGIHGVARQGKATSFPSSLAMSNTWDTQLMYEIMDITATEARGKNPRYNLSYWNPTINMARDPRWGRNEEAYGEDPYLTSEIATQAVKGMQGDDEKYIKLISTLKHFAANNCEGERQRGSSVMTDSTLREYYTRAFRDTVEDADPYSVMSSYNAITLSRNGERIMDYIASSVNPYLLTDLLARTWGFNGYVVGDCGAWSNIFGQPQLRQKTFPNVPYDEITQEMAVTALLNAGSALDCGNDMYKNSIDAVNHGLLDEGTLDHAVYQLFLARMKTGEFDDGAKYQDIKSDVLETDAHVAKAEQAAEESWVLLKNDDNTLPLKNAKKVAVVGNMANTLALGDYSGSPTKTVTPIEGMKAELGKTGAEVNHLGAVSDTEKLFNVKSITLVLQNGSTRNVDLSKANISNGMTLSAGTLKDVTPQASAVIKNVDFKDVVKVRAEIAQGDLMGGSLNIGYGNQTEAAIQSQPTADTNTYVVCEGDYTGADGGYNGVADLCLSASPAVAPFSVAAYKDELDAADTIIAYAGTVPKQDGFGSQDASESHDRASIDMPTSQAHVQQLCDAYPEKTVVVMSTVGQMNVDSFKDKCKAILWTSYNGQTQGSALGKVLTGEVNPSGKLSTTWYAPADLEKMPIGSPKIKENNIDYNYTNYEIKQADNYPGRTYMYYGGTPVYPFGYGTSYTTYSYSNIAVDKTNIDANGTVTVSADITNTGSVNGTEVAQLYVSVPGGDGKNLPLKQLKGFERVDLNAGETKKVSFDLDIADVFFYDETLEQNYIVNGEYTLKVSPDADAEGVSTKVNVTGTLSDGIKNIAAVPSGIKLVGATDGSTVTPANAITANASVTLKNDKLIKDAANSGAKITYSSSNTSVANVTDTGAVTAGNTEGTATITVTAELNGVTVSDSFPVVTEIIDRVASEITAQYLAKLEQLYKLYPLGAYTDENKVVIESIYNNAKAAIEAAVLEDALQPIIDNARADFDNVERISLTNSYTIKPENPNNIIDNTIDYRENGIGCYTALENEITGTITVDNPCTISLSAFKGLDKENDTLVWSVNKLDASLRKAPEINSETGELKVYENGIFKVTASNYSTMEYGEITVFANLQTEAESADSTPTAVSDNTASGGLYTNSNDWLRFDGIKLKGLKEITMRVKSNEEKTINVSLGSNTDRLIASAAVSSSGWTEISTSANRNELSKLILEEDGCGTIYVGTNGADLDYIKFTYINSDMDVLNESNGKIKVNIPYENGKLIISQYEDNGALQSVTTQDITAAGDYTFDGCTEGQKVTFMFWDSLNGIKPLTNAVRHEYAKPQLNPLTIFRFDDAAFDSFYRASAGSLVTSGTGMDGYGGWQEEAKSRSTTYNGKSYTFTRGLKGGRGTETSLNVFFTPDADGVITVFFDANEQRCMYAEQGDKKVEKYGTASGVLTALEMPVVAGIPVSIYGGGSNKVLYAVFFDTEKEYVEATPAPPTTPPATQPPLPSIDFESDMEFEAYAKCWPEPGSKRITKTAVDTARGGYVIDNTKDGDTFYFGERSMDGLTAIDVIAGTKESGVVTVEFFAVDISELSGVDTASQTQINALLTAENSLGSVVIEPGKGWNDFKHNTVRVVTDKTGNHGLFMKTTTTGKYCGNFDYMTFMYANTAALDEYAELCDEVIAIDTQSIDTEQDFIGED